MKWTKKIPCKPGYYWWKDRKNGPFIHLFDWLDEDKKEVTCLSVEDDFDPNDWGGLFAGPLTPPLSRPSEGDG